MIFTQVILGIFKSLSQLIKTIPPQVIYLIGHSHKFLGYSLALLGKIQTYVKIYGEVEVDGFFVQLMIG